ncbi:MAG: hypothetical protein NC355_10310 [Blautia sp.]|nr:hypothetical protein [Blautia sp.]
MATKVSSGLTLTTDYFMRNFYKDNRNAITANGRNDYSKIELSYEDSRALSRAARRMMAGDYSTEKDDEDIDDTTKSSIEAFVSTYNNALKTGDADDHDTKRYLRQLKSLSKKYEDELEDIGITIEKDGSLSINDELLKLADVTKVGKVFSPENEFSKKAWNISKKLNEAVQNNIYTQVTGQGLHINITM